MVPGIRARMACKPDSVTSSRRPATIHLGPPSPTGSCSQPGPSGRKKPRSVSSTRSLFGLAPGGACRAADVAAGAVGSYSTVSPLPRTGARGGLFSVALSLGSPRPGVTRRHSFLESGLSSSPRRSPRPPGHPRVARLCGNPAPVNARPRLGQRRHETGIGRIGPARRFPAAGSAGGTRRARRPARPPARDSRPFRQPCGTVPDRRATASTQTARPPSARRRQSNFGPGSALRPGAMSECAMIRAGGMLQRATIPSSNSSSAAICGSEKGGKPASGPGLSSSIPIERELTSLTSPHRPAPACQARSVSGTRDQTRPSAAIR